MIVTDKYSQKYVVFLDLLGFKSKVCEADEDYSARKDILNILDLMRDTLCQSDRVELRFTHFSDCIVFSAIRSKEGFFEILESINLLATNLLNYDFFVRGGWAVGGIHHDENFVYGAALNQAWIIESKKAVYPRVLVSDEVLADVTEYKLSREEMFLLDIDDQFFVHYMKFYADYSPTPIYAGKAILDDSGKRIVNFIRKRLRTHDGRIREKAQWFQEYWNRYVASNGFFDRIEPDVPEQEFEYSPTVIVRRKLFRS